jgi:hypothetical protein
MSPMTLKMPRPSDMFTFHMLHTGPNDGFNMRECTHGTKGISAGSSRDNS